MWWEYLCRHPEHASLLKSINTKTQPVYVISYMSLRQPLMFLCFIVPIALTGGCRVDPSWPTSRIPIHGWVESPIYTKLLYSDTPPRSLYDVWIEALRV